MTTARLTPAARSRSKTWSISGLPATSTSGLGRVAVSGRIRLPSPAAITIAVSGTAPPGSGRIASVRLRVMPPATIGSPRISAGILASNHAATGASAGCAEIALEIAPHARAQRRIARLAVALPQPGEDADDLGVPLRAEHMIGVDEIVALPGRRAIAVEHRRLELGSHIAPRILQQRDEIVGRMPGQRVLEIEQPERRAAADQHQVLGMIIAQHRHRRAGAARAPNTASHAAR